MPSETILLERRERVGRELDDTELWRLWQSHDALLRRSVARRAGRSATDPDVHDAVYDSVMRLRKTLRAGHQIPTPAAWLTVVAWREFLRNLERAGNRPRHEALAFRMHERLEAAPSPEVLALQCAARQSKRRALRIALATVPPAQRETLVLAANGASYEQIAARRGTTFRAVDRALGKARRRLRANDLLVREATSCE